MRRLARFLKKSLFAKDELPRRGSSHEASLHDDNPAPTWISTRRIEIYRNRSKLDPWQQWCEWRHVSEHNANLTIVLTLRDGRRETFEESYLPTLE